MLRHLLEDYLQAVCYFSMPKESWNHLQVLYPSWTEHWRKFLQVLSCEQGIHILLLLLNSKTGILVIAVQKLVFAFLSIIKVILSLRSPFLSLFLTFEDLKISKCANISSLFHQYLCSFICWAKTIAFRSKTEIIPTTTLTTCIHYCMQTVC